MFLRIVVFKTKRIVFNKWFIMLLIGFTSPLIGRDKAV